MPFASNWLQRYNFFLNINIIYTMKLKKNGKMMEKRAPFV